MSPTSFYTRSFRFVQLAVALSWATAAVRADTLLSTTAFNYTGGAQSYVVPSGTDYVVVKAWGAGGGSGINAYGGGGGFVSATYNVSAGQGLTVLVGGGGGGYCPGQGGWPNGGGVGDHGGAQGGGGGSSRVYGGAVDVWAGGGGGGCWGYPGGCGGGPGAYAGDGPSGGGGGSQSSGGAGGDGGVGAGTSGEFGQGGYGGDNGADLGGAGGGGGYYGGGGGGLGNPGAGGGGSSFAGGSSISSSYLTGGGNTAGATNDPNYPGGAIGYGSDYGTYLDGRNGYVIVQAFQRGAAPTITNSGQQNVNQNQPVDFAITATANPAVSSYGASGLPSGLVVNTTTGHITGRPTASGTFTSTITATNNAGTASATLTWVVAAYSISASQSVSPRVEYQGNTVTLSYSANANFGLAWVERVIWRPNGSAYVVGNVAATSNSFNWAPDGGAGQYWYQIRVVDSYYNYTDYWYPFWMGQVSPFTATTSAGQTYNALTTNPVINFGQSVTVSGTVYDPSGQMNGVSLTGDYGISGYWADYPGAVWWISPTSSYSFSTTYRPTARNTGNHWMAAFGHSYNWWGRGFNLVVNKTTPTGTFTNRTVNASASTGTYTLAGGDLSATFTNPYSMAVDGPTGSVTYTNVSTGATVQVGTQLAPGTYTIRASYAGDANYNATTVNATFTVQPPPPVFTSASSWRIPQGSVVAPFTIAASNSPTSYSVGTLPAGLSYNSSTRQISGIPSQSGTFTVGLSASNGAGTGSQTLTITVVANGLAPAASLTTADSLQQVGGSVYIRPTDTITLRPGGSADSALGISWTENNVFRPDNSAKVWANQISPNQFNTIAYVPDGAVGTYTYKMRLVDNQQDFIDQNVAFYVDGQAPTVPAGLVASAVTGTSFTLSWNASTDNYNISRYEVRRDATTLPQTASTSIAVTGLTQGTTYSMSVRVRDAAGNWSAWSTALPVTTANPPSITSALTWRVPQNSVVAPYTITASGSVTSYSVTGTLPAGLTFDSASHAILGSPTQAGTGTVAINAIGPGGTDSKTLTITVVANGLVPAATVSTGDPVQLYGGTYYIKPGDTITLQPGGVADASFGISWTENNVFRPDGTAKVWPNQISPNHFNPSAYVPDSSVGGYYYKMRFVDVQTDFVDQGIWFYVDGAAPTTPAAPTASAIQSYAFTLKWSASSDNYQVAAYQVKRDAQLLAPVTGTTMALTGLSASTTYSISVRARDAAGNWSAWSPATSVTTLVAPPDITSAATWSVPLNSVVAPYVIAATNSPTSYAITGTLPAGLTLNATTGQISGIPTQAGASTVTLRATNAGGTGTKDLTIAVVANALTSAATITTSDPLQLEQGTYYIRPTDTVQLQPGGTADAAFGLSWTENNVFRPDGSVRVFANQIAPNHFNAISYTPDGGLGVYSYKMRLVDLRTDFVDQHIAFYVDGTAPSKPENVAAANVAASRIDLSWSASTDNYNVKGYEVRRDSTVIGFASGTGQPLAGLSPLTYYTVSVRARDAAGNWSPWSDALTVRTPADTTPPSVADGLHNTELTVDRVSLAWSASSDDVGVVGYKLVRTSANATTEIDVGLITNFTDTTVASGTTYTYVVKAYDGAGNTSAASPSLTIAVPAAEITSSSTASGTVGTPFSYPITASHSPVSYSATNLPPGLRVNSSTGIISGSPTQAGSFQTVVVTATAANGVSAEKNLAITVAKGNQTIVFAPLADRAQDSAAFALGATVTSGLPITFSITSGPAHLDGQILVLSGARGTVTVRASQDGNSNYNAAVDVERSFVVTPPVGYDGTPPAKLWYDFDHDGIPDEVVTGSEGGLSMTIVEWVVEDDFYEFTSWWYDLPDFANFFTLGSEVDGFSRTECIWEPEDWWGYSSFYFYYNVAFSFNTEVGYEYSLYENDFHAPMSDWRNIFGPEPFDRAGYHWYEGLQIDDFLLRNAAFVLVRRGKSPAQAGFQFGATATKIGITATGTGPITVPVGTGSATINLGTASGSITLPGGSTVSVSGSGAILVNGNPVGSGTFDIGGGISITVDSSGGTLSLPGGPSVHVNPDGSGELSFPNGAGIKVGSGGHLSVTLPPNSDPTLIWAVDTLGKILQPGAGAVVSIKDIFGHIFPMPSSGVLDDVDIGITSQGKLQVGYKLNDTTTIWIDVIVPPRFELAVDANRDGQVNFGSEDSTVAERPYRFWINDDDDTSGVHGEVFNSDGSVAYFTDSELVPRSSPDYTRHGIVSARNLEDFGRLWINLNGLQSSVTASGGSQVGLKWKSTMGTPAVNLYVSADAAGSDSYLKNNQAAYTQITNITYSRAIAFTNNQQTVGGSDTFIFPLALLQNELQRGPVLHLLFEGAGVGTGQLEIVLLDKDGNQIREGPGVWFNLRNIKTMYERAVATTQGGRSANNVDYLLEYPRDFTGPDTNNFPHPIMSWAPNDQGYPFEPDQQETKSYIIYVHGWRLSPDDATIRFAETAFKRLWHAGYKGRFAAFRWPTLYGGPDDGDDLVSGMLTFNESEYRAWKSAESLKQYVNQLPSEYDRNVMAHSMGNIVASEAIRNGMEVHNYAMLNAAVSASCYDTALKLREPSWTFVTPNTDSDPATWNLAYAGRFASLNDTHVINFYLTNDSATFTLWNINNTSFKPQYYQPENTGYEYRSSFEPGNRLRITFPNAPTRNLKDPHEGMALACQSQTFTAGVDYRVAGSIKDKVNMDSLGFGTEHSAHVNRSIQDPGVRELYRRVLNKFGIAVP